MLLMLGWLLIAVSAVCGIIVLIAAFQDEIWKGIVGLICNIYLLYYAIVEWENPNKWTIFAVWLISGFLGGMLMGMGGASAAMNAPTAPGVPAVP